MTGTGGIIIRLCCGSIPQRLKRIWRWSDFYGVLPSLFKLVEVFALYELDVYWLAWVVAASWAVFLVC